MRCLKVCFMLVAFMVVPCFCGCSEQIEEPTSSEQGVGDPASEFEGAAPERTDPDSL